jgi:hypothetical protein
LTDDNQPERDYLWDGSGPADPDVARLETLLAEFRHTGPAPQFSPPPRRRSWLAPRFLVPAAAAAALLFLLGVWVGRPPVTNTPPGETPSAGAPSTWEVATLSGQPRIGAEAIAAKGRIAIGQLLETDGSSRATIKVGTIGQVEVEPDSRIRLVNIAPRDQHLALDRGTIRVVSLAPPWIFQVDTPHAVAIDLGCSYTLSVDASGAAELHVTSGWVQLERGEHQSLVPAGAMAFVRPGLGPGAPFFEDAPEKFRAALADYNFAAEQPQRARALDAVLAEARPRDVFTLLNLLWRTDVPTRKKIYDRVVAMAPPPPGVTAEGMMRADDHMIDLWWEQLGVGRPKKSIAVLN